jgi:uncharacterized protein YjbI with pentapeptide repeats
VSTRWPVDVVPVGPTAAGCVAWREHGQLHLTVIAKATFALAHGRPMTRVEPVALARADHHFDRSPLKSVETASDLAPYRPYCDVTLIGHAHAPPGRPLPAASVHLGVFRGREALLDKTLHVFGDRLVQGGAPSPPRPFQRLPLTYERAAGSPENPVGIGAGTGKLPNVVDPRGAGILAGFAPISRYWRQRKNLIKDERVRFDQDIAELGDTFPWEYFQAAPPDQCIDFLRGDEWLVLDGLHPALPRFQTQLPGARASAQIATYGGVPSVRGLSLVADTLAIDADRGVASIVWRARFPLQSEGALPHLRVAVAVELPNQPAAWPELLALPPPSATQQPPAKRSAPEVGGGATAYLDPNDLEDAPATPFEGDPAARPAPRREPQSLGQTAYVDPAEAARGLLTPFPLAPVSDPDAPLRSGVIPWREVQPAAEPPVFEQPETFFADGPLEAAPLSWRDAPPPSPPFTPPPAPPPEAGAPEAARFFHAMPRGSGYLEPARGDEPPTPPRRSSPNLPIINPTKLTAATLPWQIKPPQDSLTVLVKGTFDLVPDGPARLRDEGDPPLGDIPWDDDETRSNAYGSDYAIWKPKVDVTVVGSAYAPGGGAPAAQVELRFASIRRKLAVFGDRSWKKALVRTAMTDPQRFTRMPLVFERAFGGPKHPTNPCGVGHKDAGDALPNLEDPSRLIASPNDSPAPVCFAPIPIGWPERAAKMGTYGGRWLKTRWPYFPDDFDWHYFQNAPPSQQLESVIGDEAFSFVGMHPEHPRLEGTLPALRVRAFAERTPEAGGTFEEIQLKLDTIAFDVDGMKLSLVWRGMIPVSEEEAPELNGLFVLQEALGDAPIGLDAARSRYVAAALPLALLEDEPEGDGDVANDVQSAAPEDDEEAKKAEAEADSREAALMESLRAAGVDVDAPPPDPPPPPSPAAMAATLREAGASEEDIADVMEAMLPPPADVANDLATLPTPADVRAAVIERLAAGEPFDGLDLDGAELSDLDFSGRSLKGVFLQDAQLERSAFAGADLEGAQLSGAELGEARLDGANLTGADFTGARLEHASLVGARLDGADLSRVRAASANFDGCEGTATLFADAQLAGARFEGAKLVDADFTRAAIDRVSFRGAHLPSVRLYDAHGTEVVFDHVVAPGARADGVKLLRSSVKSAELTGAVFEGADVSHTTFFASALAGSSFERANGTETVFVAADLREARLRRAKLAGAQLLKANLMSALLERADLTDADLRGANLHACEVWRAKLDGAKLDLAIITPIEAVEGTVDAVIDSREAFDARLASGRGFEGVVFEGVDLSGGRRRRRELRGRALPERAPRGREARRLHLRSSRAPARGSARRGSARLVVVAARRQRARGIARGGPHGGEARRRDPARCGARGGDPRRREPHGLQRDEGRPVAGARRRGDVRRGAPDGDAARRRRSARGGAGRGDRRGSELLPRQPLRRQPARARSQQRQGRRRGARGGVDDARHAGGLRLSRDGHAARSRRRRSDGGAPRGREPARRRARRGAPRGGRSQRGHPRGSARGGRGFQRRDAGRRGSRRGHARSAPRSITRTSTAPSSCARTSRARASARPLSSARGSTAPSSRRPPGTARASKARR